MTEAGARAVLTRLATFLDQFTCCFVRRGHRAYASRCLQGLLNDSERSAGNPGASADSFRERGLTAEACS